MPGELDRITDAIYEAAVVPELWPQVLADIAKLAEAVFGSLFVLHGNQPRWIGMPAAEDLISDFYAVAHPNIVNPRIARAMTFEGPRFGTDYDMLTKDEIARDPFYHSFMYPRGYGWTAGTRLDVPGGDTVLFTLERKTARGNFEPFFIEQLNALRPHLGRASLLASRADLQRSRTMTAALEMVGLPAAALRANGSICAANAGFEKLMPGVVQDQGKRLGLADVGADALFVAALASAAKFREARQSWSIPVAARESRPAVILHVMPVCRTAHDVFAQADLLVIASVIDRSAAPSAQVLQGLFDLTPAEARVARGIAEGQSVGALATMLQVSRNTIRTQLQAVLSKTGLRRQAELANLLSGTKLPD